MIRAYWGCPVLPCLAYCLAAGAFSQAVQAPVGDPPKAVAPLRATEKYLFAGRTLAYGLAFSPDGRSLAAGDQRGKLVVWEFPSGKEKFSVAAAKRTIKALAFTPDSQEIAVCLRATRTSMRNAADGTESFSFNTKYDPKLIVFNPNGITFAVILYNGGVEIQRTQNGSTVHTYRFHTAKRIAVGVAVSSDGKRLASSITGNMLAVASGTFLQVWELSSKAEAKPHWRSFIGRGTVVKDWPEFSTNGQIRQTGNRPLANNFCGKLAVKLGKPFPNLVIPIRFNPPSVARIRQPANPVVHPFVARRAGCNCAMPGFSVWMVNAPGTSTRWRQIGGLGPLGGSVKEECLGVAQELADPVRR